MKLSVNIFWLLQTWYSNDLSHFSHLKGYTDTCYLPDPCKAVYQVGYVFMNGGSAISYKAFQIPHPTTVRLSLSMKRVECV